DAVTISPSPPLRPSRRRRETQHATQKAESDDGASKTREASSPVKDRRRADRRRFEQKKDGSRMGDRSVMAKRPPARSRSPVATRFRVRQSKVTFLE
ncbi:hypothetical protein LINPERPRIM_LOCUS39184, partial [Linum perenne]